MADPVDEFLRYREEDRHESELLASRTNTLLTSQSFFAVAAAALYGASPTDIGQVRIPLVTIGVAASMSAHLGGRAIRRGFLVLRAWHEHGGELIAKYKDRVPNPIAHCYLEQEYRPDSRLRFRSVDYFGSFLAYLFSLLWLGLIASLIAS